MKIKIYEYKTSFGTFFKTNEIMEEECYKELEVEIPEFIEVFETHFGYAAKIDGYNIDVNEMLVNKKGTPSLTWYDGKKEHFISLRVLSEKEKSSKRTIN